MTTNDNEPGTNRVHYFFAYTIKNEGVINSTLSEQETRDKLNRELASFYGPDGLDLVELRPATEEEVAAYNEAMASRLAETFPETTIN